MSNIYDMSGKKKVIFTENLETNITYKEIMKIVIENATEEAPAVETENPVVEEVVDTVKEDKVDEVKE